MSTPYAIFCANPLDPRSVEPDFALEFAGAREAGFSPILIDHDEVDQRISPGDALRKTRIDEPGVGVYRGWMLRSEAYAGPFDTLLKRGVRLLTSPEEYAACHHAPGSYALLKNWMAHMTWVPLPAIDDEGEVRASLTPFGSSAVILKDFVKSQAAGYWSQACYISDASDQDDVNRVVRRFRELQGDSLVGGLVFKAYIPLQPIGAPAYEYRAFFVGGRVAGCWPRSDVARGTGAPPAELMAQVAVKVPSAFASADFGVDQSGRWWLLEVGDGQVSGLPEPEAAIPMFAALADRVRLLGGLQY
jgi:ATP-grasp domain, R2K clade family 3